MSETLLERCNDGSHRIKAKLAIERCLKKDLDKDAKKKEIFSILKSLEKTDSDFIHSILAGSTYIRHHATNEELRKEAEYIVNSREQRRKRE